MKRTKKYFVVFGIITAFLALLFSLGITERDAIWVIRPGSPESGAIGIAVRSSSIYVAGFKNIDSIPQPWIAKYRDDGMSATLLWENNLEEIIPSENIGRIRDIVVDKLNRYVYVVGGSYNNAMLDSGNVFIVVLDTTTGDITKSIILDVNDSGLNDMGEGITEKDGIIYIIGTTLNVSGISPGILGFSELEKSIFYACYITDPADETSLTQAWLRIYDTPSIGIGDFDFGGDIVTSPGDTDIYLAGSVNVIPAESVEHNSAWIAKINSEGEIIWTRNYSESLWMHSVGWDISYGSDRHLKIIGAIESTTLFAEYNPDDGTMLWAETYRSTDNANTVGRGIASIPNGQVVWTGLHSGGSEDNILVKTPTWRSIVPNEVASFGCSGEAIAVHRKNIYVAGHDGKGIFIGKYKL